VIRPVAWRRSLLLESFGDAAGGLDGAVFRFAGADSLEQNGCRQRLEGYLSCQQRLALAVA